MLIDRSLVVNATLLYHAYGDWAVFIGEKSRNTRREIPTLDRETGKLAILDN